MNFFRLWLIFALCIAIRCDFVDLNDVQNIILDGNYTKASEILSVYVQSYPDNVDVLQLFGTVNLKLQNYNIAAEYLGRAVEKCQWKYDVIVANYIEALRLIDNISFDVINFALEKHPSSVTVLFNIGVVYVNANYIEEACTVFDKIITIDSNKYNIWKSIIDILLENKLFGVCELYSRRAIEIFPNESFLYFSLGASLHFESKLDEAILYYSKAEILSPNKTIVLANLAAAFQSLGKVDEALVYYKKLLPLSTNDAGVYNNYGALLETIGDNNGAFYWLNEALRIDPYLKDALINLAGYYQDIGLINETRDKLDKILEIGFKSYFVRLRSSILMLPVHSSWASMINERNNITQNLKLLLTDIEKDIRNDKTVSSTLNSLLDRIHFYIPYCGINDRYIQQLIQDIYRLTIEDFNLVSPQLIQSVSNPSYVSNSEHSEIPFHKVGLTSFLLLQQKKDKVRVGFVSKFFGIFEPHGLLLDGVMKYLPRDIFEVIALPVARTDGKPVDPSIVEGCDVVYEVSLSHEYASAQISSLEIDILIFADTMSEPMTHFLAHRRTSPMQIAFWGNPITSASTQIDYFVSADLMEHPYRNRMMDSEDPYSEQVVLLDGQGIWYDSPESVSTEIVLKKVNLDHRVAKQLEVTRARFNISDDWFVYFCPQSVFKMHPLFDKVMAEILKRNPLGHIFVTGGRKEEWTKIYIDRLHKSLGFELSKRLHMIPRVSSEQFIGLLSIADVLLHPFPFDGSRTSADGILAGIPFVTLPTEYLRGRMGASFYRTMNIPELVARNMSEYVAIATKLGTNQTFHKNMVALVKQRGYLVWEDMEYPYEWTRFLARLAGKTPPTWLEFLAKNNKDLNEENNLRDQRNINRAQFRSVWGNELYMLYNGVAVTESELDVDHIPWIFNDWQTPKINWHEIAGKSKNSPRNNSIILDKIQYLSTVGRVDESYNLSLHLLPEYLHDPHFLLNFGVIQYFRGEYFDADRWCNEALKLAPYSMIVYTCIGVANTYLGNQDAALQALTRSFQVRFHPLNKLKSNIFKVSVNKAEYNFLATLKSFGKYQECYDYVSIMIDLPPISLGGGILLIFSVIKWSETNYDNLLKLEVYLKQRGLLYFPDTVTLLGEILRIQEAHSHVINVSIECYLKLIDVIDPAIKDVVFQIIYDFLVEPEQKGLNLLLSDETNAIFAPSDDGVVLVTQYFRPHNESSQIDIDAVLYKNLANKYISRVYILTEELYYFNKSVPTNEKNKLQQIVIEKRLTFKDSIEFINNHLSGKLVILANADIYFDDTLARLYNLKTREVISLNKTVLALLKWRDSPTGISVSIRSDSQDAWIFNAPLNSSVAIDSDFYLGAVRCDNRFAEILHSSNYNVINPTFSIHAIELQRRNNLYNGLYGTKGSTFGESRDVLVSDSFIY